MSFFNGIKSYLVSVMLKKGMKQAIEVGLGFLVSSGVISYLSANGIEVKIDPIVLQGGVTAIATGLLEMLRNFLKAKIGIKWL